MMSAGGVGTARTRTARRLVRTRHLRAFCSTRISCSIMFVNNTVLNKARRINNSCLKLAHNAAHSFHACASTAKIFYRQQNAGDKKPIAHTRCLWQHARISRTIKRRKRCARCAQQPRHGNMAWANVSSSLFTSRCTNAAPARLALRLPASSLLALCLSCRIFSPHDRAAPYVPHPYPSTACHTSSYSHYMPTLSLAEQTAFKISAFRQPAQHHAYLLSALRGDNDGKHR